MIYTRVDTYSVVLYSSSISQVLNYLGLNSDSKKSASLNSYKKHDLKTGDTFVWTSNGIRFEAKYDEYNLHCDADNIFDVLFTYLRVYISSEGIDFIEDANSDVEGYSLQVLLSDAEFWSPISEAHNVTRCDFAFDFININQDQFEKLRRIIASADFSDNLSKGGRLYNGKQSGITYSYHGGSQRTIYIGSPGSEKLLRIYDKKFQFTDSSGNFDISKVPKKIIDDNITIDSWYRMELQARTSYAERYLVSCQGDFRYILGEIASDYDIRTLDGKTIAPLHKIFLNTKRVPIVQNANCVAPKNEYQAVCAYLGHIAHRKIIASFAKKSPMEFIDFINITTKQKMNSSSSEKKRSFVTALNQEISMIAEQEGLEFDTNGNIGYLIKQDDGSYLIDKSQFHKLSPYGGDSHGR